MTGFAAVFHPIQTRRIVGPLVASDLPKATRWLLPLCWHAVTLLFVVLTGTYGFAAFGHLSRDAVVLGAILSGGIAILCGMAAVGAGYPPWRHPASYVLGGAALLAGFGG